MTKVKVTRKQEFGENHNELEFFHAETDQKVKMICSDLVAETFEVGREYEIVLQRLPDEALDFVAPLFDPPKAPESVSDQIGVNESGEAVTGAASSTANHPEDETPVIDSGVIPPT